jgi:Divergent InlB B-repeat domain
MHRIIDAGRGTGASCGRVAVPACVLVGLMLALPAMASAANQTLTVEKKGAGTGTVTSSPAGISCGETCAAPFAEGTKVVLSAVSGPNSTAVQWTGCAEIDLEGKCKVTMSTAKTVTATFELVKRKLTVEKKGAGTGTVTSSPAGIGCGATCGASFTIGTAVTLTAAPGPKTLKPSWAGCDSVDAENKCLVTMSAARTVTVTLESSEHQLTVKKAGTGGGKVTSSPAGIDCGSTCSVNFSTGALVTLTGAAEAGSQPVAWTGCDSIDAESKCLVTMSAEKTVTATFNLTSHQLTVSRIGSGTGTVTSSPAGIDCGETCAASFVHNTAVVLTGVAGLHTEAVKWTGCDTEIKENKCLVAISAAKTVTATFDLEPQWIEYTVSVQRIGTGKGTVTSSPGGIECGEDCSEKYVNKTRLTLIATPEPGSAFDHWSGGNCAGTGPCERTINSSRLVKAVFVAVGKRTLTVSRAGSGSGTVSSNTGAIHCGATCSAEIEASSKITLTAEPAAGSTFAGWSGACTGTAPKCKLAMNEARNVTATFAQGSLLTTPGLLTVASPVKVKGGKALLRVSCHFGPCKGTLKLFARLENAQGRIRRVAIGSVVVDLQPGASAALKVRLSQGALASLRQSGRLRVAISGGGTDPHSLRLSR